MKPKIPDPVIDEIREIRHCISASFGHDPAKYVAYLMQFQQAYRDRLIYVPEELTAAAPAVLREADGAMDSHPSVPAAKS